MIPILALLTADLLIENANNYTVDTRRQAVFNDTIEVARQRTRAIPFSLVERPATVVCSYKIVNDKLGVRAVLLSAGEMEQFREGKPTHYLAKTEFARSGQLRHRVTHPGDYRILLDNRDSNGSPAQVSVRTWLEFEEYTSFAPTTLPQSRQRAVVAFSLVLFSLAAAASGWRLWATWRAL
jgi:hypothetical protein